VLSKKAGHWQISSLFSNLGEWWITPLSPLSQKVG